MNCLGPRSPLVLMLCGWSLRVPKHPITEVSRLRRDLQLGRPDKTGRSNAASASEGPYFKPSSPQRADLVEPDTKARLVEINGQVLTRSCRPVERALVDLWHADEHGEYDNAGFRYRGHLFTDGEGRYRFRTILPALYPGRTRHYHVKVQAPERPVLTTQLYFPDEPTNRRDRPESWFQIPFQWRHLLPMTA
jgi:protocatechuate 3,4-dioxygenase beta subunit